MFRDCEDVTLARQVARACEQPFELIPVGDEFLSKFARYAEQTVYRTDGCASVKNSADLYVNERAFQIAPVRMTGNYGGEILRQVRAFKPVMPAASLFRPDFYASVEAARGTYSRLLAGNAVSFIAFRQVPWHHYGLLALEQSQISMRSPYLDNDIVRLAYRAQGAATAESDVFKDSDESVRPVSYTHLDVYKRQVFVWSQEAAVHEIVPASRCNRRYLLKRALLRGSNFSKHPAHRIANAARSLVAVPCYTIALPVFALFGQHVFLKYLIKPVSYTHLCV